MGQIGDPVGPCSPKSVAFELTIRQRADLDPLLLEPCLVGPQTTLKREENGTAPISVLRETWQEALRDMRTIRWARGGLWFLFFCWVAGLVTAMIVVPLIWSHYYMSSACLPDGTFSIYETYNPWDIKGFFQITSGFGELTFTQAKVVDVAWDVAVGRIGQTILVVFSWRAFSLHIKASVEEGPGTRTVSYHTYWTIFMQDSISIVGVIGVIRDFVARRRLKSIAAMVFMTATMLFVLAWPTVASAMTGYDSNNVAFIKIRDGSLVPFSSFVPLLYIIHDGSRVDGLTDEYLVPCCNETTVWDPTFKTEYSTDCYCDNESDNIFTLANKVSVYARTYGLLGLNNTNSSWPQEDISLPSPALNISASPASRHDSNTYGSRWTDPRTGQRPFLDEKQITYIFNNETYDFEYIITQAKGQCQPIGTYKWGFSFLQAFVAMLMMGIWTLSVYIMWLKAHLKLSSRGPYEIPNRYKAAVKLTRSITVDFGDMDQATAMSNKQFSTHVSRNLRGGRVGGDPAMALGKYSLRSTVKEWIAREKWWFSGIVLCTLFCCIGWMLPYQVWGLQWVAVWLWPTIVFALAVGTTKKSRFFFLMSWLLVGLAWILPIWVASVTAFLSA